MIQALKGWFSGKRKFKKLLAERSDTGIHILIDLENGMKMKGSEQLHNGGLRLGKLENAIIVPGRFHYCKETAKARTVYVFKSGEINYHS